MTDQRIHWTSEVLINEGCLDKFREYENQNVAAVRETEPGTLHYVSYISRDGTRCQVVQWFRDTEAVLHHLRNADAQLHDELFKLCQLNYLFLYTPKVDPAIKAIFDSWGIGERIVIFDCYDGFIRAEMETLPNPDLPKEC